MQQLFNTKILKYTHTHAHTYTATKTTTSTKTWLPGLFHAWYNLSSTENDLSDKKRQRDDVLFGPKVYKLLFARSTYTQIHRHTYTCSCMLMCVLHNFQGTSDWRLSGCYCCILSAFHYTFIFVFFGLSPACNRCIHFLGQQKRNTLFYRFAVISSTFYAAC